MKDFKATIMVEKSMAIVFKAITADLAKWWGGKDLNGNSTKLNDEFIIHHPDAHYSKQQLVEFIPIKKIVWLVTESKLDWLKKNKAEWTGTKMIFELTCNYKYTVVNFTHEGLDTEMECYDRVTEGWNLVIKDQLYNFITTGKTI